MEAANKSSWANLQITAKELIGVIVFVFSISGIYYKMYYGEDYEKKTFQNYMKITDARLQNIEEDRRMQNKIFSAQLEILMDDLKNRRAIEEFKKSGDFVPLKKEK